MTTDDILRMAREAHAELLASGRGMHVWHEDSYAGDVQAFCERFAALVAAAESKKWIEAIDAEPEFPGDMPDGMWQVLKGDRDAVTEAFRIVVRQTKDAIRARGKT